jgi:hypothetical protein
MIKVRCISAATRALERCLIARYTETGAGTNGRKNMHPRSAPAMHAHAA